MLVVTVLAKALPVAMKAASAPLEVPVPVLADAALADALPVAVTALVVAALAKALLVAMKGTPAPLVIPPPARVAPGHSFALFVGVCRRARSFRVARFFFGLRTHARLCPRAQTRFLRGVHRRVVHLVFLKFVHLFQILSFY
jgi:hypothetical protein